MPKVAPATSPSTTARPAGAPFHNAQVLRRNQACHQCRRRKLKWYAFASSSLPDASPRCPNPHNHPGAYSLGNYHSDAKRPCSTCVRSHAYAVAHAAPGTDIPPCPECTFDEISEPTAVDAQEVPKNRFERLENRITELEAMLKEKDQALSVPARVPLASTVNSYNASGMFFGLSDNFSLHDGSMSPDNQFGIGQFSQGSPLDDLAGVAAMIGSPTLAYTPSDTSSTIGFDHFAPSSSPGPTTEVLSPSWPKNLPNYTTLRHLVEAFFNFAPFSGRMFHAPSFLASLSLPPTHPNFPFSGILHAMCALGSMYTAAIKPSSPGGGRQVGADSFADGQIRAAKRAAESSLRHTVDLFGSFQAYIIIALWYWYNARWSEACVSFAVSLRYTLPCGLNVCPPFEGISSSNMGRQSLIPPALNVVEDEMRRNTFWIGYMVERQFAAINNFAMFMDDADVCQMLPISQEDFEQGVLVPPRDRQWSHDPNCIEQHMEDQTDSFVLHVKSTMLLSRVKVFNVRYNSRFHLGDPAMMPSAAGQHGSMLSVPAFIEVDQLITAFQNSLPSNLRDPLANGVIDASLLTAISNSHFARIILHEGHAVIGNSGCLSSCKILASARAILQLLYEAYSTSHNLALLGVFPMVCWFAAGRVLIRFLRAALDADSEEHITSLQVEIDFIRSVITGIGERVPHAYHYGKMLTDYLTATCGKEYAQPVNVSTLSMLRRSDALSEEEQQAEEEEQLHSLDVKAGLGSLSE